MRRLSVAMLLLLATAFACNATVENVVVGDSHNCVTFPDQIYKGEQFYVCGDVYLNGVLLSSGTVNAKESVLGEQNAAIVNGKFSALFTADVVEHQYYYITLSLVQPCEKEFEEVPVEIKTDCIMVPPSTIEVVPNVIEQGERFVLEVKNSPSDVYMEITGLTANINTLLVMGDSWSQTFDSNQCSLLGSCIIHFEFTDTRHSLCTANADLVVTVKAPARTTEETEEENIPFALATLFILVVGTAGAILLNRYI